LMGIKRAAAHQELSLPGVECQCLG
jgi:hypothetical protein